MKLRPTCNHILIVPCQVQPRLEPLNLLYSCRSVLGHPPSHANSCWSKRWLSAMLRGRTTMSPRALFWSTSSITIADVDCAHTSRHGVVDLMCFNRRRRPPLKSHILHRGRLDRCNRCCTAPSPNTKSSASVSTLSCLILHSRPSGAIVVGLLEHYNDNLLTSEASRSRHHPSRFARYISDKLSLYEYLLD